MAYVYAIGFKGGFVKIGATTDTWQRAIAIAYDSKRPLVEMVSAELLPGVDMYAVERSVLELAGQIAEPVTGREYFRDLPFNAAVSLISRTAACALVTRRFGKGGSGISLAHYARRAIKAEQHLAGVRAEAMAAIPAPTAVEA